MGYVVGGIQRNKSPSTSDLNIHMECVLWSVDHRHHDINSPWRGRQNKTGARDKTTEKEMDDKVVAK